MKTLELIRGVALGSRRKEELRVMRAILKRESGIHEGRILFYKRKRLIEMVEYLYVKE